MCDLVRSAIDGYPELLAVLVAAGVGLSAQSQLSWVERHDGIDLLLAVLVFATALTIEAGQWLAVGKVWRLLVLMSLTGVTVLPLLSWAVGHLVAAGPLRSGVIVVGVAPCEIASVATTGMAAGSASLAAGALVVSTFLTTVLAGPVLALEVGRAHVSSGAIVVNLGLVVALPLLAGLALRAAIPRVARYESGAQATSTMAVAALVAVIAAEVHLSYRYWSVGAALIVFLVGSVVWGRLLAEVLGVSRSGEGTAVLLTTSMRDFAIAAGVAASAFGAAAAAPLGLYGIVVLCWGTGAAGFLRGRVTRS